MTRMYVRHITPSKPSEIRVGQVAEASEPQVDVSAEKVGRMAFGVAHVSVHLLHSFLASQANDFYSVKCGARASRLDLSSPRLRRSQSHRARVFRTA